MAQVDKLKSEFTLLSEESSEVKIYSNSSNSMKIMRFHFKAMRF